MAFSIIYDFQFQFFEKNIPTARVEWIGLLRPSPFKIISDDDPTRATSNIKMSVFHFLFLFSVQLLINFYILSWWLCAQQRAKYGANLLLFYFNIPPALCHVFGHVQSKLGALSQPQIEVLCQSKRTSDIMAATMRTLQSSAPPEGWPKTMPWGKICYYNLLLYCNVLYFTLLYSTVLYCTVLYCTVLYCTVLYSTVLYWTVLYCNVLNSTVMYCTVLYSTVLSGL